MGKLAESVIHYLRTTPKEQLEKDWEELKKYNESDDIITQPNPQIKTWVDVLNQTNIHDFVINHPDCDNKLKLKLEATYKIQNLIEYGYGGMITKKEWEDNNLFKWLIVIGMMGKPVICNHFYVAQGFISFHTKQQAEEFMFYKENRTLVEQYYMI